jgi:glycosyltransferase involved in cell wall biosynthesis
MRIAIIGSRGLPAGYGGFETFAEEISVLLAERGFAVTVQCDRSDNMKSHFKGVGLFYSTTTKSENPLKYYSEGLTWGFKNSDIVLVTGSGGAIYYFRKKPEGKVLITNTDGIESRRTKWSAAHKIFLKLSEWIVIRKSDYIIADSESIKKYLTDSYGKYDDKIKVIEYGSHINDVPDQSVLKKFNLQNSDYYLVVCRLEPENNVSMIIEGYRSSLTVKPLVIVGNLTDNKYVNNLFSKYNSENVRFVGAIFDRKELNSLRYYCKAYIHGHSVGGTNPSLLEAMGSRNIVLCHDNQFNREVTGNAQSYFANSQECAAMIRRIDEMSEEELYVFRERAVERIRNYYNWEAILKKYLDLIHTVEKARVSQV